MTPNNFDCSARVTSYTPMNCFLNQNHLFSYKGYILGSIIKENDKF